MPKRISEVQQVLTSQFRESRGTHEFKELETGGADRLKLMSTLVNAASAPTETNLRGTALAVLQH